MLKFSKFDYKKVIFRQLAYSPFNNHQESCSIKNPQKSEFLKCSSEMTVTQLRDSFLTYFRNTHDHKIVSPSTIYPKRNEGSYFINSGMNQFKSLISSPPNDQSNVSPFYSLKRATNCQPCLRIGGRFNDLNDVGYDQVHLTMFEMMGSWSFDSYTASESCAFMWQYLVNVLKIPKEALYITYFGGDKGLKLPADLVTRDVWLNLGVSDTRLMPFGKEHNYWQAGNLSGGNLSGPCTEIHLDVDAYLAIKNNLPTSCARCHVNSGKVTNVVEIWNCVFITSQGESLNNLSPIPRRVVDTGLGLERLYATLNGTNNIYQTNLFGDLIRDFPNVSYTGRFPGPSDVLSCDENLSKDVGIRIILDHFRSIATAMHDGLLPGRQGLALKIRQLIHRSLRAAMIGVYPNASIGQIVDHLVGGVYKRISTEHAETYQHVLEQVDVMGLNPKSRDPLVSLDKQLEILKKEFLAHSDRVLSQEETFLDAIGESNSLSSDTLQLLTQNLSSYNVDMLTKWYNIDRPPLTHGSQETTVHVTEKSLEENLSTMDHLSDLPATNDSYKYIFGTTKDGTGLNFPQHKCTPLKILNESLEKCDKITKGSIYYLITDSTNHYAAAGGQESDHGTIHGPDNKIIGQIDKVLAVKRRSDPGLVVVHRFLSKSSGKVPEELLLSIDSERRESLMLSHTGQHLFNHIVSSLMGSDNARSLTSIKSVIRPDHFVHIAPVLLKGEKDSIENLVHFITRVEYSARALIQSSLSVSATVIDQTVVESNRNIIKYQDVDYDYKNLRLVTIGDGLSEELCGGTHSQSLGPLKDLLVVNVTNAKSLTKQFKVLVGERAAQVRINSANHLVRLNELFAAAGTDLDAIERCVKAVDIVISSTDQLGYIYRHKLQKLRTTAIQRANDLKSTRNNRLKLETQLAEKISQTQGPFVVVDNFYGSFRLNDIKSSLENMADLDKVVFVYKHESSKRSLLCIPNRYIKKLDQVQELFPHIESLTSINHVTYVRLKVDAAQSAVDNLTRLFCQE